MRTPVVAELPNSTWQHIWGGSLFLDGQPHSHPNGQLGSQRSPDLGFPSIYAYAFDAELPNLTW